MPPICICGTRRDFCGVRVGECDASDMRVQIRSRDSGSSSGPKLTPNRFGATNGLPRWRAARSRRRSLGSSAEFARAARGTGYLLPPFATINEWSSRSQRDVPTSGSCAMSVPQVRTPRNETESANLQAAFPPTVKPMCGNGFKVSDLSTMDLVRASVSVQP
jgi:hypothetical protein